MKTIDSDLDNFISPVKWIYIDRFGFGLTVGGVARILTHNLQPRAVIGAIHPQLQGHLPGSY